MREIRALTQEEKLILQRHAAWLADEAGGKRANLSGADLSGADLYKADLRRAILNGVDLREADLSEANLRRADLRRADLRGADLCGAALGRADLREANLRKVELNGADLREVDLYKASLYRVDLFGAKNILAFGPIGSRLDITYAVKYTDGIMIKCGCFWGDLEQWQAQCRATHGDNSHAAAYAAAANFIKAYAAAYWQD